MWRNENQGNGTSQNRREYSSQAQEFKEVEISSGPWIRHIQSRGALGMAERFGQVEKRI